MNVRGKIVFPSRPARVGGAETTGRNPGLILYVRAGSERLERKFRHSCGVHGVDAVLVHEGAVPGVNAYECVGTYDSLGAIVEHPAVLQYHAVMDARPPRFAPAPNPHDRCPKDASARVRREVSMRRLPVSAQDESDRRELWDETDKLRAEAAEARELPH